jgi:thiol-disulfide isomerase/thioredoxin
MSRIEAEIEEVTSAKRYEELVQLSQKKVVIIDLYQSWCGPCSALVPSFNKVAQEFDEVKERVVFARCDYELFAPKVQATLPSDCPIRLERHGCLPLQAIYRFGSNIGLLQGVDGPALLNLIDINAPAVKDKD